jgi:hypothetical protein
MKSVLREPLVHFLLLGGLLFLYFEWRGGSGGPGGSRIAITPGIVEHLASGFGRTWRESTGNVWRSAPVDGLGGSTGIGK